jgi:hypothetical protein
MKLVIGVLAYLLLVIGLATGERYLGILTKVGLSEGPYLAMILFGVYLVLLYLEVRSARKAKETYDVARRKSSRFSFSIGVVWGFVMSFAAGFHYELGPLDILLVLIACAGVGSLFCLLGRGLTKILWNVWRPSGTAVNK